MRSKSITFIYWAFILFFASVVIYSLSLHQRHYVFDSILAAFFMTIFYRYYDDLKFDTASFVFIGIGISMHELGRFGFYGMQFFGINWDIYTHTASSFAMAIILYTCFTRQNKTWQKVGLPDYFPADDRDCPGGGIYRILRNHIS